MSTPPRVKPNLFVIGAAKSGTTSLHHFLAGHPEIFMSDPKEPGFFAEGMDYYPSDEEWYLGLFQNGRHSAYRGESSTHYTKLPTYPGVAQRMARFCDSPRLIYLMRDPIDRAISHYWHRTRQDDEFRPPLEAIEENEEYRAFGDYAYQLEPYICCFERDAIFIETFESLISEPERVTFRLFRWLGLEPTEAARSFPEKNTAPNEINRFQGGKALGEFFYQSTIWNLLSPFFPQIIKDIAKKSSRKTVDPSTFPRKEVEDYLRPWAREVVERTSQLLDRDFPEWSTTCGEG